MRKIIITNQHRVRAENAVKPRCVKPFGKHNSRGYGQDLKCGKCGKILAIGDVAYRAARHFLCQDCGKNSEI